MYVVVWIFEFISSKERHEKFTHNCCSIWWWLRQAKKGTEESVQLFSIFYLFVTMVEKKKTKNATSRRSSWGSKKRKRSRCQLFCKKSWEKYETFCVLWSLELHKMQQKESKKNCVIFLPRICILNFSTSYFGKMMHKKNKTAKAASLKIKAIDHRRHQHHQQACNFSRTSNKSSVNSTRFQTFTNSFNNLGYGKKNSCTE